MGKTSNFVDILKADPPTTIVPTHSSLALNPIIFRPELSPPFLSSSGRPHAANLSPCSSLPLKLHQRHQMRSVPLRSTC